MRITFLTMSLTISAAACYARRELQESGQGWHVLLHFPCRHDAKPFRTTQPYGCLGGIRRSRLVGIVDGSGLSSSSVSLVFAITAIPTYAQPDPPLANKEAETKAAEWYAKDQGIDVSEAMRRLQLMHAEGYL